ncbi:MAG: 4-alpha-glucanotransferase, partial [Bdellovibrionales bacterium]
MTFTPSTAPEKRRLRQAARLWGLQPDYTSAGGATVCVPERTLVLLLQVLSGRTVDNLGALDELVQWARERLLTRWLESVHVIRAGATQRLRAHLPESAFGVPLELNFECEAGERFHEHVVLACPERWREFRGRRYGRVWIPLSRRLEAGYHHLEMRLNGECKARARLLCAPDRSKRRTSGSQPARCWGGFAPLYGLQSSRDWGIGDLRDMEDVQSFLHSQGAAFFGTLPLLSAVNEGETADPSPYSPVSRLFWNEIFLDVDRLVNGSPRVKTEIEEPEFQAAWERLRKREFVEHRDVYALKKKILRALAREFFDTDGGSERLDYKTYLSRTPGVDRYAEFRAQNRLESPDRHEREKQYHLYVQYQMDSQLRRLHERSRAGEIAGLYLDYPVGVSKSGFDSREFASRFVHEVNAGAPPDTIFPGGQDWGFSPFHPQGLRDAGYDYFIECMRRNMRYASVLRLDHIMAFFRIYAIPEGVDPKSGTYIRYRAEEFFAILEIESQRASVRVVGEDLGTVPERVRQALVEHGCLRMWVLPF